MFTQSSVVSACLGRDQRAEGPARGIRGSLRDWRAIRFRLSSRAWRGAWTGPDAMAAGDRLSVSGWRGGARSGRHEGRCRLPMPWRRLRATSPGRPELMPHGPSTASGSDRGQPMKRTSDVLLKPDNLKCFRHLKNYYSKAPTPNVTNTLCMARFLASFRRTLPPEGRWLAPSSAAATTPRETPCGLCMEIW